MKLLTVARGTRSSAASRPSSGISRGTSERHGHRVVFLHVGSSERPVPRTIEVGLRGLRAESPEPLHPRASDPERDGVPAGVWCRRSIASPPCSPRSRWRS